MAPFDPTRAQRFYSAAGQRASSTSTTLRGRPASAFAFAVVDTDDDDRLIGRVAPGNVVRGPWQNATLGYWVDEDALGRGHCTRP